MTSKPTSTSAHKAAASKLSYLGLLLITVLLVFCGQSPHEASPGGETHFLMRCTADSSACQSGLACLCGVCTQPCQTQTACQSFTRAECVLDDQAQCGGSSSPGHCDVRCSEDAECQALSASHRCEQGSCRAAAAQPVCTGPSVDSNQVLVIGDSFFGLSHQITAYLEELARNAGAIASGERYRDNSRPTENALAFLGNGIAEQYRLAVSDSPVKVVIMNGGGADVLAGSCDVLDANCPLISNAVEAAAELLAQMAADGVQHVVYAFYPDPIEPGLRAEMDVLRPGIKSVCDNSPLPCHWLDLRTAFAGRYPEFIEADGINPTAAGSRTSATEIWSVMREQCIAQ